MAIGNNNTVANSRPLALPSDIVIAPWVDNLYPHIQQQIRRTILMQYPLPVLHFIRHACTLQDSGNPDCIIEQSEHGLVLSFPLFNSQQVMGIEPIHVVANLIGTSMPVRRFRNIIACLQAVQFVHTNRLCRRSAHEMVQLIHNYLMIADESLAKWEEINKARNQAGTPRHTADMEAGSLEYALFEYMKL